MGIEDIAITDMLEKEFNRGKISKINELIEFIKQRKYVWNEEKFGSVKNHKMFDLFVEELILELKKELLGDAE